MDTSSGLGQVVSCIVALLYSGTCLQRPPKGLGEGGLWRGVVFMYSCSTVQWHLSTKTPQRTGRRWSLERGGFHV